MYILLAAAAGAGLAVQAVVNARLRGALDSALWASIVQVFVGLVFLAGVALLFRQPPSVPPGLSRLPWWAWTGGVLGAVYVAAAIIGTVRLGAAATIASIIVGQTVMALVIDHYGWFGVEVQRLSLARAGGAALMFLGLLLIRGK